MKTVKIRHVLGAELPSYLHLEVFLHDEATWKVAVCSTIHHTKRKVLDTQWSTGFSPMEIANDTAVVNAIKSYGVSLNTKSKWE